MAKIWNVVYMGNDGYKRQQVEADTERGAIKKSGFKKQSKHDKLMAKEVKDAEGRCDTPSTEHRE